MYSYIYRPPEAKYNRPTLCSISLILYYLTWYQSGRPRAIQHGIRAGDLGPPLTASAAIAPGGDLAPGAATIFFNVVVVARGIDLDLVR